MRNRTSEGLRMTQGDRDVVERLNTLADACRAHGIPVILADRTPRPDRAGTGQLTEIPSVTAVLPNQNGERSGGLRTVPGDIRLSMPRFGAFTGTDLDPILRSRDRDLLIIGGISTHIGCDTTAREAAARDYRVVCLSDGMAIAPARDHGWGSLTAGEVMRVTLTTLAEAFAEVTSCDDVARRLAGSALSVARAYHLAWTSGDFAAAETLFTGLPRIETPIGTYESAREYLSAMAAWTLDIRAVELIAEHGVDNEAMLLYDVEVNTVDTVRVAEHLTFRSGRIARIRRVHDTALMSVSG
ncbi:isochorismatase family protein [Nocardia sp. NPDC050793]|uniref:isochorismatase family protein n=1 Tax=Nocardia sp. NPDC050793 TaxID=3155159 RepID=UPI0033CB85F1